MTNPTNIVRAVENAAPADDAQEVIFDTEINAKSLYVGTRGDLILETAYGNNVTFTGVQGWVPVRVKQVLSDSTVGNVIALF